MGDVILHTMRRASLFLLLGIVMQQSAPGQSVVVNPGFESGTTPWAFYSNGVATFSTDAAGAGSAHAARIAITAQGSNVQLYQAGVSLEASIHYTLTFKAYSNTGHDLSVILAKHTTPYTNYGLISQRLDLTASWNTYSVQFTASGFSGTVTDARLRFWLADDDVSGDVYYIDDVVLSRTASAPVAPSITQHPANQTVTVGQTAAFTVVASGTAPLTYQWQKGSVNIGGATAATYTTPATVIGDNGSTYRCVVTNSVTSVTSNAATLTVNAVPPPPPPSSGIVSDDFSAPVLNTSLWTFVNPVGDGVVSVTGTQDAQLSISIPAGVSHDLWVGSNNSPRLLQSFKNSDFEVETRFEAPMTAQYQMQGIVAQQDNSTFVRFDFVRDASNTRFFCASFSAGTPTVRKDTIIVPGNLLYLRVKRQGNAWTGSFSYNGTAWITAASFNSTLTVNTVGPFAGNHGIPASASPAWTARIDYFFNTGSPITPEDGSGSPVAPSIATHPANQTVMVGQTAAFTVAATGTTPMTYQWQKGSTNIGGATAATYTTPATVIGDNGSTYRCVVTNSVTSVTSNAATLTVNVAQLPPSITQHPANQTVTVGQTAAFTVAATGTTPMTYQWQKGSVNIGGATAATYTTPATVIGDNGSTYRCVVTNSVTSVTSNAATLTVNAVPPPPSSGIVSDDFSAPVLNTSLWTFVNPVGDGVVSVTGTGTQDARLSISMPAGVSHDLWVGSNNSPRLLQSFNNSDFEVETRFEAPMTAQYQMQGIVAQQDNSTFVRFDFVRDAVNTRFFCASFSAGTPTVRKDTIIVPGNPLYLRVKRQGNAWTGSFSYNGTAWITAASFNYTLTVNTVGPFAGNHGIPASTSPAWTARIDYFFNTGSPITPEDGSGSPVAPSITQHPANQTVMVGQTAAFTVAATGTTPMTYQWQKSSVNIGGAIAATYTTPATVIGDDGSTYQCVVTNSVTSVTSNAATLTIQTTPITLSFAHHIIDSDPPRDPHDKGIGDIDGDGFIDVLAASSTNFTEGLFWYKYPAWTKHSIHTGSFSTSMAVADIDGDGDPDVIIAKGDWYGYTVWAYVNPRPSGDPAVGASWQEVYVGDAQTHDIEVGDISNDGKPDIVIRGGNTTLFVQNTLTSWTKAVVNTRPFEGTSLADIDADGDLDIAINGYWLENPLPGGNPVTAQWTEHLVNANWLANLRVLAADLNGDGRQDLLYVPSEYDGGKLAWYESATPRTGPWTEHTMATGVGYVHTLEIADMDRDGRLDVVTAEMHQSADPDQVLVYRNAGGGLTWDKVVVATTGSHNAQLGDIGNDGDIDIVGANWDMSAPGGAPIEYWENLGGGGPVVKSLDQWTYILADNARGASIFGSGTFGLGFADLNGDGYQDIASGHYFYRNPGSTMTTTPWPRVTLPGNPQTGRALDAFLLFDAEGTGVMNDIIAEDLPSVTWLRANDAQGTSWTARVVAQVPVTVHGNGRTVISAHIVAANTKPDILLSGGDGIYLMQIPSDPASGSWPIMRITTTTGGEQKAIGTGDIDRDGDLDIAVAAGESQLVVDWWSNPGNGTASWIRHVIGTADASVKMIQVADVNADGRPDVIVTEDASPASVYWFEAPVDAVGGVWVRHTVAAGLEELDSMSGTDMNNDGMPDIVVGEIFGAKRLIIYENVNNGSSWIMHVMDSGKESHNGARVVDLNNDGNPDVVSIAYYAYADMHVWRNDAGPALKIATDKAVMARSIVDAEPIVKIPTSYGLRQNYPNPFNPTTTIGFDLPGASYVRLAVFNTLGEQVAILQDGERQAGYHEVRFDARELSSGVYFYRITAGAFTDIRKLLLVR